MAAPVEIAIEKKSAATEMPSIETPAPTEAPEFPQGLRESLALLTEMGNIVLPDGATREQQREFRAKHARLKRHVFNLQQPAPAPNIGADEIAALRIAQGTIGERNQQRLKELQAVYPNLT